MRNMSMFRIMLPTGLAWKGTYDTSDMMMDIQVDNCKPLLERNEYGVMPSMGTAQSKRALGWATRNQSLSRLKYWKFRILL